MIPAEKRERILRQRNRQNADHMLVGEILARYAVKRHWGMSMTKQRFVCTKYGKPYPENISGAYFNISHSGQYVVCAVHTAPIGIDVQEITPYSFDVARRVCSEEELEQIQRSRDRDSAFIRLWTRKEAVLKRNGTGILGADIRHCLEEETVASRRMGRYWISVSCEVVYEVHL